MIKKLLASRFVLSVPALAVVIALFYQVRRMHEGHVRGTTSVPAGAPIPAKIPIDIVAPSPQIRPDSESSRHAQDVILALLAKSLPEAQPTGNQRAGNPAATPTHAKPNEMTMLSISNYDQTTTVETLSIQCRTDGYLSNAVAGDHIVVKGVVTQDVVSAGKILIPAGSKVAGIAHVDPDTGRLESKGKWSIYAVHNELRIQAELLDAEGGFHGVAGRETSFESELAQRQAVVRDGRYCFLADKTPFVLSLNGEVSVTELKTIASPE